MSAVISTAEQDGWAYVATGSETYALWERHRQRESERLRELARRAPVTAATAELQTRHVAGRTAWKTGIRKG